MFHPSLETKPPWRSTRQRNNHFLRHHSSSFSCLFSIFLFNLRAPPLPQCIGSMVRSLTHSQPSTPSGLSLPSEAPSPVQTRAHTRPPNRAQSGTAIATRGGEKARERVILRHRGRGALCQLTPRNVCPKRGKRTVQLNTCPVTPSHVTGLLIAPPKIGHYHHLYGFACSSAHPCSVSIETLLFNIQSISLSSLKVEFILILVKVDLLFT